MPGGKRALFIDWGGTLAFTKDNRTVVDAAGHPVLMPNVAATLARERARFELCFIVSNQGRITRGEISEAEVVRRFAWANERLGGPFTGWRLCPHNDEDGCDCRKPKPGMFLELAGLHDVDLPASVHVGDSEKDRDAAARAGVGRFVWARDFFGWGASTGPGTRQHGTGIAGGGVSSWVNMGGPDGPPKPPLAARKRPGKPGPLLDMHL